MDYEKKYNELVAKLKKASVDNDWCDERFCCVINSLFPELAESEDEKIKKALVAFLKETIEYGGISPDIWTMDNAKKWIAWLEKQKQKPTDKVEPKFHEGEWITNCDYTWKIVEVKPLDYILQSQDGNIVDDTISHVDEQFHLWTIEDAKDGDVLQLGKVTAIFKEFIGNGNCKCYCSVCNGEFEIPSQNGADNSYGCHNATSATKEQRDTLMKAMADAGHTFDFEKKELNKIEEDCVYGEQKPYYWSEEDKKKINRIYQLIAEAADEHAFSTTCRLIGDKECVELQDFLRSLKPLPKQDWSEEDERMIDRVKESLNCFIDSLEENTDLEDDTRLSLIGNVKNEIKWVESLRDKTKWKPNTEDNKPSIKHSVLMKTVDGIAEGEWQGDDLWYQYRWCSRLKDSDVLAWMELSDLKGISYDTVHR